MNRRFVFKQLDRLKRNNSQDILDWINSNCVIVELENDEIIVWRA